MGAIVGDRDSGGSTTRHGVLYRAVGNLSSFDDCYRDAGGRHGTDSFGEAIVLALVVGIGYAAAVAFVGGIFDTHKPQPMVWFTIFSGYQVVGLMIVATIVALWD